MSKNIPIIGVRPVNGFWNEPDIWTGEGGTGSYVPHKGDTILRKFNGTVTFIDVLDVVDNIAVTQSLEIVKNDVIDDDLKKYGIISNSDDDAKIYIDTSKVPFEMNVDPGLCWSGSELSYAKVFLGTDISGGNSKIISQYLDGSGSLVSENIPLRTVLLDNINNHVYKTLSVGYCNSKLMTGEKVTVVLYNKLNRPVKTKELRVIETSYIRHGNVGKRKVSTIELKSQFIDSANNSLLKVPLKLSLRDVPMLATVRYDNGESIDIPVNTGGVKLNGTEAIHMTYAGQRSTLNLTYTLGPDEVSDMIHGVDGNYFIQKTYEIEAIPEEGAYNVKLDVVPQWNSTLNKWELNYYLYTLDRNDRYNVTPYVQLGSNSPAFDGTNYRETQWLTLVLDLGKINDNKLKPFNYTQKVGVTLYSNGLTDTTSWTINYNESTSAVYGKNLKAKVNLVSIGHWELDISNGFRSNGEFLDALYYATEPMFDSTTEPKPPTPTHMRVTLDGVSQVIPFTQWDERQVFRTGGKEGESVTIEWIRNIGDNDLILGITPLKIVHYLNDGIDSGPSTQTERLVNEFFSVPLDDLKVDDFNGNNSVLEFQPDGRYGLMWSSYISDWINGETFDPSNYQLRYSVVDRWESSDKTSTIEVTGLGQDTWYDMNNVNRIVLTNTTVTPSGASITLEAEIRRKDIPDNVVVDTITITKK